MIKFKFLILNIIILACLISGTVEAGDEYVKGVGEAVLGSGLTIEQAKEIALQDARRDAISRFGVYIESETIVEDYVLVKDKITSITAGIVRMEADSEEFNRVWSDDLDTMKVIAEANFIINRDDFEARLNKYIKRQESNDEIEELLAKIDELEKKIEEYSKREEVISSDVQYSLDELKELYRVMNERIEMIYQKEDETKKEAEKQDFDDKQVEGDQILYGIFSLVNSPLWINAEANQDSYEDLTEGYSYSLSSKTIFADKTYVELEAAYYELNEKLSGLDFNLSGGYETELVDEELFAYYGAGLGLGRFKVDLDNDLKEIVDEEVELLRRLFFSLNAQLGLRAQWGRFNIFSDLNYKKYFIESNWYYDWTDELEAKHSPYSDFEISNPLLRIGVGLTY